jgi:hypothetical protein
MKAMSDVVKATQILPSKRPIPERFCGGANVFLCCAQDYGRFSLGSIHVEDGGRVATCAAQVEASDK